jgi:hypothetical protein
MDNCECLNHAPFIASVPVAPSIDFVHVRVHTFVSIVSRTALYTIVPL